MTAESKKAGAETPAKKNKRHNRHYQKGRPLSNLKIQISQLLLLLLAGNEQPDGWQQFDQLLRQVYEGGVL